MALIAATGSTRAGLVSTAVFSDMSTTVAVPTWARTIHVYRAGDPGADDLVITLTDLDGATVEVDAVAGCVTPWPITIQGQQGTLFRLVALAGTAVDTRISFSAGSYVGPT